MEHQRQPGGYLLDVAGYVKGSLIMRRDLLLKQQVVHNSWARFYMRSGPIAAPAQSWFMGTSKDYIGNQLYIADETFGHSRLTIQPNNGLIWLSTAVGVGINTSNTAGICLLSMEKFTPQNL